nr:hypothetical protein [Tanacetum cinerariifolium]
MTSRSEDEEYAMAVRDFKEFFKRRGRCGDPNHLIEECLKPPRDKNQRAFVGVSWSYSGEEDDEKAKDETVYGFNSSWFLVKCKQRYAVSSLMDTAYSFGVDAAMVIKEKYQVFTAASEDISAARQKLMLLVTAAK